MYIHSLTHGSEPLLRSHQVCSYSRNSQHFMEPEDSLQCSQESSTGPYPQPDQSHPTSPRSILILCTHPFHGLTSGLLPSGFHTNILYAFLFSPIRTTCPPWLDHANYTWRRVQVMKLFIMLFFPTSCHFISLRSKYSPQTPSVSVFPLMSRDQISHPHRTTGKIIVLYILIFIFF
jgi:hypothetical protein